MASQICDLSDAHIASCPEYMALPIMRRELLSASATLMMSALLMHLRKAKKNAIFEERLIIAQYIKEVEAFGSGQGALSLLTQQRRQQ